MAVSILEPRSGRRRRQTVTTTAPAITRVGAAWREGLPALRTSRLTLREVRHADATTLAALMNEESVTRFLAAPPATPDEFRQFIDWTHQKRREGSYACFGIVPRGMKTAVGFFQLRALDSECHTAEWGFALGRAYWGSGYFVEGARAMLTFVFEHLGIDRLEARVLTGNARANAAMRKIGATSEAILRRSFEKDGTLHDTRLWSLLDTDWRESRDAAVELPVSYPHIH
ncbi:MAG: GNAT family N-acetyltransferase [Acidobacteria bacterium]|nr:GNAT family N-acetyltransferase [Acidobacteriota bacterium]